MTSVVIGFSKPKQTKIGSEIIKWYMSSTTGQKVEYSHVYLQLFSRYTGQWLVYHASHGMVHILTLENFLQHNTIVKEYEVPVADDDLKNTITKAQQLLGRPYGYLGLLKLVLKPYLPKLAGDGSKSFHCSEIIVELLPALKKLNVPNDFIQPVHVQKALESGLK